MTQAPEAAQDQLRHARDEHAKLASAGLAGLLAVLEAHAPQLGYEFRYDSQAPGQLRQHWALVCASADDTCWDAHNDRPWYWPCKTVQVITKAALGAGGHDG